MVAIAKGIGHVRREDDILKDLVKDPLAVKDLKGRLRSYLPAHILSMLEVIGGEADKLKAGAFVVGGFVRDLLLGVENYDLDIVIESDAISFAKIIAKKLDTKVVAHKKFGTAIMVLKNGLKIDFATARTEYYEYPAALPTVEYSSIRDDLLRRDFTINAMALKINKRDFGRLIDFFRGQRDLKAKIIRVLHNLSFVEDPTRIFRAVRFEQRYDFNIDRHTEDLIKTALSLEMVERVKGQRLRKEIVLILSEERPLKAIVRMSRLHELRFIHPGLRLNKQLTERLKSVEDIMTWVKITFPKEKVKTWLVYFACLCSGLKPEEIGQVGRRFALSEKDIRIMLEAVIAVPRALRFLKQQGDLKPSRTYRTLNKLSRPGLFLTMAGAKDRRIRKIIFEYMTIHSRVRLNITGKDLKKIGLKPGPEFKNILEQVLFKKMDDKIYTKKEEVELVKKTAITHKKKFKIT